MIDRVDSPDAGDGSLDMSPEELRQWKQYLQEKAVAFVQGGYSVEWHPDGNNWMKVYTPERSHAHEPELCASVKFYRDLSSFGIDGGRISKLCVQLRSENLIAKVLAKPHEKVVTLFNYDRGHDVDRLNEHAEAKKLYDLIIRELN